MVPLVELWLPVLVSAVFVFVVSSLIHMLTPWHKNDVGRLAVEDEVLGTLRRGGVEPGQYFVPHAGSGEAMKSAEYQEKAGGGVVAVMTVFRGLGMGRSLVGWFLFSVVVSVFAGYVAGRALTPGAEYLEVFRFTGATAFAGYALAQWPETIWWHRPAGTTLKNTIDGLVYALLTAGVFGWLWPGGTA